MLSHPHTVACFPIKPAWLPLLLLPGPGMCLCLLASPAVHGLCLFAYIRVSMEGYRKGSVDNPHQSPTQKEMRRRMEDGKRDGGRHRKQHLEKSRGGDGEKVDEWMEQSGLALIELGSVVYIL